MLKALPYESREFDALFFIVTQANVEFVSIHYFATMPLKSFHIICGGIMELQANWP